MRRRAKRSKAIPARPPPGPEPAFRTVNGTCWQHEGDRNFHVPTLAASARCPIRFTTLQAALLACVRLSQWCGSVVQDTGLQCGPARPEFELRLPEALHRSRSLRAWALVAPVPEATTNHSGWCEATVAQRAAAAAEKRARHAAARAEAKRRRQARRARLSVNATQRCAAGVEWRVATSAAEEEALLAGRPSCPADWRTFWPVKQQHQLQPRHESCCRADASALLFDACGGGGLPFYVPPHARSAVARRAASALSGLRVLVVGDSVSTQWAAALVLDLRGRDPSRSGELSPQRKAMTPRSWCGDGSDWLLPAGGTMPTIATFSYRRLLGDLAPEPSRRRSFAGRSLCPDDENPLGPRHPDLLGR